jgi:hypothetical protein
MVDVEIVLRFFAFREPPSKIRGAVKTILDRYMEEHAKLDPSKVTELRDVFLSRLQLVFDIFGINAFKLGNEDGGADRLSPPLYDALMVSVDRLFEKRAALISRKGKLVAALQDAMANEAFYALIVGRANTAETLRLRIDKVERLLLSAAKK